VCVLQLLVTANFVPSSPILVNLMVEVVLSSETSALTRSSRRYVPEDGNLQHKYLSQLSQIVSFNPVLRQFQLEYPTYLSPSLYLSLACISLFPSFIQYFPFFLSFSVSRYLNTDDGATRPIERTGDRLSCPAKMLLCILRLISSDIMFEALTSKLKQKLKFTVFSHLTLCCPVKACRRFEEFITCIFSISI
jgi:hypothetical protein